MLQIEFALQKHDYTHAKLLSGTGICTLAYLEESHVVSVEHPKERESQMSFVLYFSQHTVLKDCVQIPCFFL